MGQTPAAKIKWSLVSCFFFLLFFFSIILFFSINKLNTHNAFHYSNAHYRSIFTITILVEQMKNP